MKTKPRTTRSEVIFRKAKFIFLHAAFGLPTMKTKMFLQTRTNIFFFKSCFITPDTCVVQLMFLLKVIFTTFTSIQDLYKSRRFGYIEAVTKGTCS